MDQSKSPNSNNPKSHEPSVIVPSPDTLDGASKENTEDITGTKLLIVLSSVTLVAFLVLLDQAILSTAIPQITSQFHSLPDVGWYSGAYPLASASLQPLSGKLYTYFRAKHTFLAFLFIFELGSLICGVAPSSTALIIGRVIAGLGSSGLMNGAMTIIAGSVPLPKRPLHTGLMLGLASLGIVGGPLIGGALTEYATWRWCFYINLPIGGVAAVFLFLIKVPDITEKDSFSLAAIKKVIPELDLFGFAMFAPAAIMFLLALQFGSEQSYAWSSATIIGLFYGSGAMAIIFILWERYMGTHAMIPGHIIRNRIVLSSILAYLCLMATMLTAAYYLPIYFQAVKGHGPSMSGVDVLPTILAQLLIAVISGVGVSKLGYYLPWAIGGMAVIVVGNGLISTFKPSTSTSVWIGFQIILGLGRGACMQMGAVAMQAALPASQIPIGLALQIFAQNLSASIFLVVSTTIFTQRLTSNLKHYAPSVSTQAALDAGGSASAVRKLVPEGSTELKGVLVAYSKGVNAVFYLLVGISAIGFITAWGMGWKDVREKEKKVVKDEEKGAVADTNEIK